MLRSSGVGNWETPNLQPGNCNGTAAKVADPVLTNNATFSPSGAGRKWPSMQINGQ